MKKILFGCVLLLSGCATFWNGTEQKVGFSSTPPNAKVTVFNEKTGMQTCQTPCFINMWRGGNGYTVIFSKDGYESASRVMVSKLSWWLAWDNIILMLYDLENGSGYKLQPEMLHADLKKDVCVDRAAKD